MSKIDCNQFINGILLVNKSQGVSSNAVLQRAKRLYQAKKAGHTGSLDPLATGMLPICFGEATKFCQYLLDADKAYQATGLLGIKTSTADALGEIIEEQENVVVSESQLRAAMVSFRGNIKQIPSMFSALKHKGLPLYKYAREGVNIERNARDIIIHQLELTAFDGHSFTIDVRCSKGTYIRNLVEDIGDYLGVGAHVTRLHRSYTAGFDYEKMYTLDELENTEPQQLLSCLLPIESAVKHLPVLTLDDTQVLALRQGRSVKDERFANVAGCVRLHNEAAQFIGLGELQPLNTLVVKRLLTEQAAGIML
ncbi:MULTISPECIES: tRNA pseudouridine(55) synthase TruB [unclassified Legionella]|uniref:tRNA pseudouridine(55) synthase TruB n=1 Tax=unclassified Legionella TaxID=2622702 RepID=UPI001055AC2E|nr:MULTISPECIES: tRNA pseudouridine(55) synthase TruB [unclassified Legionella]MDI9818921.1 tRNA pseudouridine(55) synthase TruB [Legionella sp. PL877]